MNLRALKLVRLQWLGARVSSELPQGQDSFRGLGRVEILVGLGTMKLSKHILKLRTSNVHVRFAPSISREQPSSSLGISPIPRNCVQNMSANEAQLHSKTPNSRRNMALTPSIPLALH